MKRFLAVLMLVVMLCGCVGLAEGKTFDNTILEGLEGYSYDKFDKSWTYGSADIENSGLLFGAMATGEKNDVSFVTLMIGLENKGKTITDIEKVAIIADDKLITISKMQYFASAYIIELTTEEMEFLQLLVNAKEISMRIYADSISAGYVDFELTEDGMASLRTVLENFYSLDLLSFTDEKILDTVITIESAD